jgi:hypothetical protein
MVKVKFELKTLHDYSDAAILDEMRRVAALAQNGQLTILFFDKHSKVASTTVRRRFGDWRKALDRAGLAEFASPVQRHLGRDEVLEIIKDVASQFKSEPLTARRFSSLTGIGLKPIHKHFGSWSQLLAVAGIEQAPLGRRYSDEECYENILKLWTHYSRQPSFAELNQPPSIVGSKAYARRWGGWRAALRAFVERVNEPTELVSFVKTISKSPSITPTTPIPRAISLAIRYQVLCRDRFCCTICGRSPAKDSTIELHIDHIVPWSRRGTNDPSNLRTLCSKCNLGKADKLESLGQSQNS